MSTNELVCKIIIYINQNINRKITLDELTKVFFFNKDYIMRVFKKELTITILDYINKKRIYDSLFDVKNSKNSMTKIALKHGFQSQEYFSETFTKIMKISPLTYRKFSTTNKQISETDLANIRSSLTSLTNTIQKIEQYLKNQKKDTPPQKKQLSLSRTSIFS